MPPVFEPVGVESGPGIRQSDCSRAGATVTISSPLEHPGVRFGSHSSDRLHRLNGFCRCAPPGPPMRETGFHHPLQNPYRGHHHAMPFCHRHRAALAHHAFASAQSKTVISRRSRPDRRADQRSSRSKSARTRSPMSISNRDPARHHHQQSSSRHQGRHQVTLADGKFEATVVARPFDAMHSIAYRQHPAPANSAARV